MVLLDLTEMTQVSVENFILAYASESRNPFVKALIEQRVKNLDTFNEQI